MTDNERDELLKSLFFKTPDRHAKKDPKGNLYVTARYVMNVLDQKVGPANWSDTYRVIDVIHRPDGTARICVECSLTVCGVTKHDVGYGELEITEKTNRKTGEVYEVEFGNYEKEAYSIALKRAAVKFGIARDLYQDGMPRFDVEPEQPDSIPGEDEAPPEAAQAAQERRSKPQGRGRGATYQPDENGAQGAKMERPYDAETFKRGYRIRVNKSNVDFPTPTEKQVQYVASLMSNAFKDSETPRADRVATLAWLLDREMGSTNDLTGAEASVLIDILTDDSGELSQDAHQELNNCLRAAMLAQGQIDMWDNIPERMSPDETKLFRANAEADA